MGVAEKIVFGVLILQGVWCGDWSVSLPDRTEALSGSCVTVNCRFDINDNYANGLTDSAVGKWHKDGTELKKIVFDSSNSNSWIKGEIIGKLVHKDCTTIFYDFTSVHKGNFNFRIEGNGGLKYTYAQKYVSLDVIDSPPNPTVKTFTGQMEVQEVLEGNAVRLRCSAITLCSSSPPTLTWRSSDRLPLNGNNRLPQQQNQTEIISDLNFTASHLQHGVTFICNITYQLQNRNTTAQSNITLRVLYPPKNTSVSVFPSKSLLEGTSVTLTCRSDANPAVLNYTWIRENGGRLEQLQTGQNLTFNVSDRTHTRYYCRAGNKHGTQNTSVLLDIQYSPKNTSVSVFSSNSVLEGTSVTLTCRSDANPAVLNYTWFRENGGRLEDLQSGQNLTFNVTDLTHTRYYCRAGNQHGTQNTSVLLDIQYPPKNTSVSVFPSNSVLEGTSVTLTCRSDANPAVLNYTWFRENGGRLEQLQTGQNLTFNVTDRTHTCYYCRAGNQHGTQNTSVLLDIQYPPKNTSVSVFPSNSVLEGTSVTLTCRSDANPAVLNYTWFRENRGRLEQLQTGQNLTFDVTDLTHTCYHCQAGNQHGTQNTSVLLDIQYAPQISNSSSFTFGDVKVCSCEAHGNPSPKVEWHLSGHSVRNSTNTFISEERLSSTYLRSIITLHQSLADTLLCVGTNSHGTTSQQFRLSPRETEWLNIWSLLFGFAVGALAMGILWVTTHIYNRLCKTGQDDKTGLVLKDEERDKHVHGNPSVLSPAGDATSNNQDSLHYSTIKFTNTQKKYGEIRCVSSPTTDYAVIQHYGQMS